MTHKCYNYHNLCDLHLVVSNNAKLLIFISLTRFLGLFYDFNVF